MARKEFRGAIIVMNQQYQTVVVQPHEICSTQVLHGEEDVFPRQELGLPESTLQLLDCRHLPRPQIVQFFRGALKPQNLTSALFNRMFAGVMRGVQCTSLLRVRPNSLIACETYISACSFVCLSVCGHEGPETSLK